MGELLQKIRVLAGATKDAAVDLKTDFDGRGKFQQARIAIVGAVLLDVLVVLSVVAVISSDSVDFEAWYASGAPSMVMITNGTGDSYEKVELTLDARYRAVVEMKPDSNGYPIDTTFSDPEGFGPARDYRPNQVELIVDGDSYRLPVGLKK